MSTAATLVRPAYRPYVVKVVRVRRLSPHFTRVTFADDALEHFGTAGLDQRIKILLPHDDGTFADVGQREEAGDWYERWRALPDSARNPFRTYTVRRIDPEAGELDVDFVVHEGAGPAGAWAAAAAVGDELIVVGPDGRSEDPRIGLDWRPGAARRILLAGDETAAPAICAVLETLGADFDVDAFIEIPTAADALPIAAAPSLRVSWLARDTAPHGALLVDAVTAWTTQHADLLVRAAAPRAQVLEDVDVDRELLWDSPVDPDGEFYAWLAGESATIKTLRRLLVGACGVDRGRVAFMGYWRLGQAERTG
ncbi:siderophore-interacting protein [Microbacterium sp.]|uniref:siderophore-interacting protein n=1 Tax=Microbacterium sp. TaxID=51671 RepID=UPI0037CBFA04